MFLQTLQLFMFSLFKIPWSFPCKLLVCVLSFRYFSKMIYEVVESLSCTHSFGDPSNLLNFGLLLISLALNLNLFWLRRFFVLNQRWLRYATCVNRAIWRLRGSDSVLELKIEKSEFWILLFYILLLWFESQKEKWRFYGE